MLADMSLECVDPWGRSVEAPITLSYRSDDPFAVTLIFRSSSETVAWIVGRNLLMQGLTAPVGEGDVRIYPSIVTGARTVVVLDFRSPDGRLVAQADSSQLQAFLTQAFAVVPAGTESAFLDIDSLVDDLLAQPSEGPTD
ncbi:MAG: SsgA family sporulation/cell division regulator [Nocardioides sp.]